MSWAWPEYVSDNLIWSTTVLWHCFRTRVCGALVWPLSVWCAGLHWASGVSILCWCCTEYILVIRFTVGLSMILWSISAVNIIKDVLMFSGAVWTAMKAGRVQPSRICSAKVVQYFRFRLRFSQVRINLKPFYFCAGWSTGFALPVFIFVENDKKKYWDGSSRFRGTSFSRQGMQIIGMRTDWK